MRTRSIRLMASMVTCGALLGACASDDEEPGSAGSAAPTESAAQDQSTIASTSGATEGGSGTSTAAVSTSEGSSEGTLTGRFNEDPTLFDPIYITNGADFTSVRILFENLLTRGPDGQTVNVLADTFEVSDDGKAINFTLKHGIQFHGGYGEVTAEDVKFSLERSAGVTPSEVEPFNVGRFTALERVDVIDTYSGTIVLSEPSATFIVQALPSDAGSIISKKAFDQLGEEAFQATPIGTGPYELAEYRPGELVRFTNFPDYGDAAPYVPAQLFDELAFQIIPDDNAAELAYEAGDLDLVGVRAASKSRFEGLDATTVQRSTSLLYTWIGMNILDPALANENLRIAIRAAIDVPSIIVATSEGEDTQARALVAPSSPVGAWKDAPLYEQDLDEARRLVELVPEADRNLTFTIADDETSRTVAEIVQRNLGDAGLSVTIETLDSASFYVTGEENRGRQLFYAQYGVLDYADPSQELVWFTCDQIDVWNYMFWCDEQYSDLYNEAAIELDDNARGALYVKMQEIMDAAAHTVWVAHTTIFVAYRSDRLQPVISPSGSVFYQALSPA